MKKNRLLILGTSSNVGKTLVTLALCRWLKSKGIDVVPFKGLSMAPDDTRIFQIAGSHYIHLHQALHAFAAGIQPNIAINPVMLTGDKEFCEIFIDGLDETREILNRNDDDRLNYFKSKIIEGYSKISKENNFIVMEGCGNPAELNMLKRDLSNFWVAETFDTSCIILANIENTGVFASLIGTISLLSKEERSRLKGFLITKFHGDPGEFKDGIKILEEKTGLPCLGILPYSDILSDFDRIALDHRDSGKSFSLDNSELFSVVEKWTNFIIKHLDSHFLNGLLEEYYAYCKQIGETNQNKVYKN